MSIVASEISKIKRQFVKEAMQKPKQVSVMPEISTLSLHDAQAQLLREKRRFNIAVCGRRFGKTVLSQEILWDAIAEGKPTAYFAPTYKMLSLVWKEAKTRFYPAITKVNVQEKRLEFVGGGALDFWSLDSFDSVRGRKYACAVIDEAAMVKNLEEAWLQAIRPTLTDYQGSAWFLSTPKGINYFHSIFENAGNGGNWQRWQLPTLANPYIQAAEIEAAKYELPELVFQQEYLAQFVEMAGTLIKREYLQRSELPSGLEYYMGVDLAISTKETADYTAIAVLARDNDGRVYVCDVQRTRKAFHDSIHWILANAEKWNVETITVEQVQYQAAAVQELLLQSNYTIRGIKPKKDKVTRFMPMQARYEQGQVFHAPHISEEYEKELLSFPVGEHDDMIDAVSYAFQSLPTL